MKRIISLICCALLSVFAIGGCADNGEPFSPKTYTADSTQIKSISIDVRDRQIEVSPSEDHQIHIDYFENDKEYYDISVSDESVLTITAADSKEWSCSRDLSDRNFLPWYRLRKTASNMKYM